MSLAIHWFRRDLRLSDNTALNAAVASHSSVIPAYIISEWKKHHRWTGPPRQQFLSECLADLDRNLRAAGSRLILRQGNALEELLKLAKETGATAIYTNRDPDPFGREMEANLTVKAAVAGIRVRIFKDAAMHEQAEVLTGSLTPFRVFTPYSKAWGKLEKTPPGRTISRLAPPPAVHSLPLPTLETWGLQPDGTALPKAGESAARERLDLFLENKIFRYADQRDIPSVNGTSRISQDLRFGLLSIREIYGRVEACLSKADASQKRQVQIYLNELCWREFYFQVLWNAPHVLEQEYGEAYRGMPWRKDAEAFERWSAGQTGFPIVDAGMRELRQTGFMHNRVRMIVAMFLTKDLHQDWRLGEQWFMQRLLDGEIASNNGGWQWSAGTGTDAAPYFRVQNPWTQSERFDSKAEYIKRWIPELSFVPADRLHKPPAPGLKLAPGYPLPMVDHGKERDECLASYKLHLARTRAL